MKSLNVVGKAVWGAIKGGGKKTWGAAKKVGGHPLVYVPAAGMAAGVGVGVGTGVGAVKGLDDMASDANRKRRMRKLQGTYTPPEFQGGDVWPNPVPECAAKEVKSFNSPKSVV